MEAIDRRLKEILKFRFMAHNRDKAKLGQLMRLKIEDDIMSGD